MEVRTITGVITRDLTVRPKVIYFSIFDMEKGADVEVVLFRQKRAPQLCHQVVDLKKDDKVTIEGKMQENKLNGELQLILDKVLTDQDEPAIDSPKATSEDFNF